jgi:hypothetical protein
MGTVYVCVGFFEHEQYEAVLAHLPEGMRPLVTFAYVTGWRINSEVPSTARSPRRARSDALKNEWADLPLASLEAIAVEAYRTGVLSRESSAAADGLRNPIRSPWPPEEAWRAAAHHRCGCRG